MSPVASLLVLASSAGLAACIAQGWQPTPGEVETSLIAELSLLVQSREPHRLESRLRPVYDSCPKNAQGNLGPEAVRLGLGRAFAQGPGWQIKGLEADSVSEHWVPAYLQKVLEERTGEPGLGLREFAVLAASLEDLIRKESTARLGQAFEAVAVPVTGRASRAQVMQALEVYAQAYLGKNASGWMSQSQADVWQAAQADTFSLVEASDLALKMEHAFSRLKGQDCHATGAAPGSSCLDVSGFYLLCCRQPPAAEDARPLAEPSALMAAWEDYPAVWTVSLVCFLLAAVLVAGQRLCAGSANNTETGTSEVAADKMTEPPTSQGEGGGLLLSSVGLCLLCAAAVAVDLLDISVLAPALAVGLVLLAAARLRPQPQLKAKKV